MMSNVELRKRAAAKHIYDTMVEYHFKKETMRRRIAAALKIQTFYRMRYLKNTSFINDEILILPYLFNFCYFGSFDSNF